jgi:hypothetical protein
MKKKYVVMLLAVLALAIGVTGVAVAQTPQPQTPFGRGPMMGGYGMNGQEGPLHEYMVTAMANALGISGSDFEARQDAGKTAYQIALDLGISADKIPALLSGARAKALEAAQAAGVVTQQQADWMKSRGAGMGNCDGTGAGRGAGMMGGGMMGRGGRWQSTNP